MAGAWIGVGATPTVKGRGPGGRGGGGLRNGAGSVGGGTRQCVSSSFYISW